MRDGPAKGLIFKISKSLCVIIYIASGLSKSRYTLPQAGPAHNSWIYKSMLYICRLQMEDSTLAICALSGGWLALARGMILEPWIPFLSETKGKEKIGLAQHPTSTIWMTSSFAKLHTVQSVGWQKSFLFLWMKDRENSWSNYLCTKY